MFGKPHWRLPTPQSSATAAAGQWRHPPGRHRHIGGSHGREVLIAALERALTFRRFTAEDVRAILAAGPDAPTIAAPGAPLDTGLPQAPGRSLDAYAPDQLGSTGSEVAR